MAAPIVPSGLPSSAPIAPVSPAPAVSPASGSAFQSVFTSAVSKVEAFQQNATQSVNNFLAGDGGELHQVAIDAQHAELSFDLFLQVRNKVVNAYQEVMRMQV